METSIQFVNHASVIISGDDISVLSDPWYEGDAFNRGWDLLYRVKDNAVKKVLDKTSHIWISHEHPDHFSVLFFKKFKDHIKEKGISILFQETRDKRVLNFLKSLSLEVSELKFNKETALSEDFTVTCIKDGFYDSGLLVSNKGEKVLNLNDCEITSRQRAKEVHAITGTVDVLLTQFSFAAWKGGKKNKAWRDEAAQEKLRTIGLQLEFLKPKIVIPFASYIFFSNEENFYLNDAANKPEDVCNKFTNSNSKFIVMKPNDIIGGKTENYSTTGAKAFWKKQFDSIETRSLHSYKPVKFEQIFKNFISYCERIKKKNNMMLVKTIRFISPISAFKPVTVKLTDLKRIVKFDYVYETISETHETPMLEMRSESLDFLFRNSFGFDTLTVNGCFEEGKRGGFVMSTKTLAIENLNNLGIYIKPSTLFNFYIIRLFLTRLYRVARKLED